MIPQFKMWSHEAEHGEGGNGRDQTQRTPSTKTYNIYEDEPEMM